MNKNDHIYNEALCYRISGVIFNDLLSRKPSPQSKHCKVVGAGFSNMTQHSRNLKCGSVSVALYFNV